jgi:hypothetical protein
MSDEMPDYLSRENIEKRISMTPAANINDPLSAAERLAICGSCDRKTTVFGIDKCSVCGCLTELKARIKSAECPLGKWIPIKEST